MEQLNSSTQKEVNSEQTKSIIGASRFIWVIITTGIVSTVIWSYLYIKAGSWQLLVTGSAIALLAAVFHAFLLTLIRRSQITLAGWLSIGSLSLLFFIGSFLSSGVGLIAGGSLFAFIYLIANQTLPSKFTTRALIMGFVAAAITAALDLSTSPYRLYSPEIVTALPIITSLSIIGLLVILAQQSRNLIVGSLRFRITILTGLVIAGSLSILNGYSVITGRQTSIASAKNEAAAIASSQAESIRADTEVPLNIARAMAQSLTALKDPTYVESLSRNQVNAMLRQVLIENPTYLGTYTLWEPNAFDGLDQNFKNTFAHDSTGRFIPYWIRGDDNKVSVIPLENYETPGIGDWYILPRQTKSEVTIAPLIYPINGVDTVMASFVVPIIYNDKFYGIAGVDAPIGFVQNIVDKINLYDGTAQAVLMTAQGTLIGVRNRPELVNKPATEIFPDFSALQAQLEAGDSFIDTSPDGQYLRAFAPIDIGKTGKHWSFALIIPLSKITAAATAEAVRQGLIGAVTFIIVVGFLWFLSGQIVRPLSQLTQTATAISQGNLNTKIDVTSTDETGLLANAFRSMVTQLQALLLNLENRVAERTQSLELASEVGRSVSQVRALDVMLTDAAELIRSRFDLYYVQVYLTNISQTYLNLQAGTGTVGKELLARSHRLPLNTGSINGRAAVEKKSVVISDTTKSTTFRPNVLLPDTRSEMAVPLIIGEKVVGVLDMQSTRPGALNQETLTAYEALAGQLAIAIQNANLLAEAEQARTEVINQARRLVRANYQEYLDGIHKPEAAGFVFEQNEISPTSEDTQMQKESTDVYTAPIAVTGEEVGQLVVEMEENAPVQKINELVEVVARQVAQQVEAIRLLENAERYRAEAELSARRLAREGWKDYINTTAGENLSYMYDLKEVRPVQQNEKSTEESATNLPLKVRDEMIGKLVIHGMDDGDSSSLELANAVADRLSAHIEGLRLSKQTEQALSVTQKQAEREQALRQITSVVRSSNDPATILRSAARELGTILGRKTIVRLKTDQDTQINQSGTAISSGSKNGSVPHIETPAADDGGDK